MSAQMQLNAVLIEYRAEVQDYENTTPIAAQAEVDYRYHMARAKIEAKSADRFNKVSDAAAETAAIGSDGMYDRMLEYKIQQARVEAIKQKLKWFENEVARLRTLVVTERTEAGFDRQYQPG